MEEGRSEHSDDGRHIVQKRKRACRESSFLHVWKTGGYDMCEALLNNAENSREALAAAFASATTRTTTMSTTKLRRGAQ